METKKSSMVTKVLHEVSTFQSKHGQMFVHEIRFENGDSGHYNSKSNTCTKFKEGEVATYTIEPNGNYPSKIKPVQEEQTTHTTERQPMTKDVQVAIIAQSVLSSIANRFQGSSIAIDNQKFMAACEESFNWVMNKMKQA